MILLHRRDLIKYHTHTKSRIIAELTNVMGGYKEYMTACVHIGPSIKGDIITYTISMYTGFTDKMFLAIHYHTIFSTKKFKHQEMYD